MIAKKAKASTAGAKKPAAKKKAPAPRKAAAAAVDQHVSRHVMTGTAAGGFEVFGTLVQPKHVTRQQVLGAFADLD
jgi:hypothetical protein